jgi:F0F1-type ATP synthase assembly protein I
MTNKTYGGVNNMSNTLFIILIISAVIVGLLLRRLLKNFLSTHPVYDKLVGYIGYGLMAAGIILMVLGYIFDK